MSHKKLHYKLFKAKGNRKALSTSTDTDHNGKNLKITCVSNVTILTSCSEAKFLANVHHRAVQTRPKYFVIYIN